MKLFLILATAVCTSMAFAHEEDAFENNFQARSGCIKANSAQKSEVNRGLAKKAKFLQQCIAATKSKRYCEEVIRPNPDSASTFYCTYGSSQQHVLIDPDEATWKNAFQAVKIVEDLKRQGVAVQWIYNWWRPDPYNQNVGGAKGRHPNGTSVDVRFTNKANQNRAHSLLCKMRSKNYLRALGYYSGTGLHLGVGDSTANTWGRSCN